MSLCSQRLLKVASREASLSFFSWCFLCIWPASGPAFVLGCTPWTCPAPWHLFLLRPAEGLLSPAWGREGGVCVVKTEPSPGRQQTGFISLSRCRSSRPGPLGAETVSERLSWRPLKSQFWTWTCLSILFFLPLGGWWPFLSLSSFPFFLLILVLKF